MFVVAAFTTDCRVDSFGGLSLSCSIGFVCTISFSTSIATDGGLLCSFLCQIAIGIEVLVNVYCDIVCVCFDWYLEACWVCFGTHAFKIVGPDLGRLLVVLV